MKYNDSVERIIDFRVVGSKLAIIKSLREYFGLTLGLKELAQYVEKLIIIEKAGVLSSLEIDYPVFCAVLHILRYQDKYEKCFEGTFDSGYIDVCKGISEYTSTIEADAWYASLSQEHQDFVGQLIDKYGAKPACG
jgi:hypothetical protein